MPTIAKLEIVPLIYRLPKGRAYGMARGLTSIRQASLVILTTDDGVEGIGEAWGPPAVTKAYLELAPPVTKAVFPARSFMLWPPLLKPFGTLLCRCAMESAGQSG